ncbi:histidine ammonia-lyase [Hoylesella shahii]|jgi:histidine ammonia-lyase|uniref:histidine ammonia-lyase n=1 Tax=Hoylesella shahii TaxID=228603 RepID=UPI001CB33F3E|nr:histidine ammonia-lyase [Hoylesella shahii]MBF1576786.1 histidine ammonia-lyase [Hoylesella shahii]
MTHQISADHLTIERIGEIIYNNYKIELSDDARKRIIRSREYLDARIAKEENPIYGVTTGFGSLCSVSISKDQLSQLQVNLIKSHACGVGERLPNDIIKMMILLKVQSLSYGFSGCKLDTVERLIDMFNNNIFPIILEQGSLGASGDLVPLAHMSLPLVGLGEVDMNGEVLSGEEMNRRMNWKPIELASKEGLALLNGTQNMSAQAVWAVLNAQRLSEWADVIAAMSLDAFDGRIEPFTHAVHAVRPHQGQIETAARFRQLLEGSKLIARPKKHVQDPYSFRCVPQVHGTVKDTLRYVYSVIDTEINSATDNPTVCPDEDLIISAGNFHGEPIALPMDYLAIAMSELANISERRIYRLVSGLRELPSFLVAKPGLNSGFMIAQYTAASVVSLNKSYAVPSSIDSIPSCQDQEDLVSMGANAAIKLRKVVENTERVLAIELFNAAQALDFRRPLVSSPELMKVYEAYRKVVPFIDTDVIMYPHIEDSVKFLRK